uniref:(northern house mosquito) hypothetical protein n=1 Tax=Culex pipiens TaxID=7175 RepID=A0A8D8NB89_CULPI
MRWNAEGYRILAWSSAVGQPAGAHSGVGRLPNVGNLRSGRSVQNAQERRGDVLRGGEAVGQGGSGEADQPSEGEYSGRDGCGADLANGGGNRSFEEREQEEAD